MPTEDTLLDEIIYARVLITLQRIQLDEQDSKLRKHLKELVGGASNATQQCQKSLRRAWDRASHSLGVHGELDAFDIAA